jgi:hypothetical protein
MCTSPIWRKYAGISIKMRRTEQVTPPAPEGGSNRGGVPDRPRGPIDRSLAAFRLLRNIGTFERLVR